MPLPSIYLITDRRAHRHQPEVTEAELWQAQLSAIHTAAQAGCQFIQIREKDLTPRSLTEFTRAALASAHPHGTRVLVNDRLDVALAAGADGVHLRVNSIPTREARQLTGKHFLIGVSTHSLAEAQAAARDGADFIVCGPVYDTPSKRAYGAPLGLARLAEICREVSVPVFALGGITLENYHATLQHGAAGIAGIGLFNQPEKLAETIQQLLFR